jgi:hypothetical protein
MKVTGPAFKPVTLPVYVPEKPVLVVVVVVPPEVVVVAVVLLLQATSSMGVAKARIWKNLFNTRKTPKY